MLSVNLLPWRAIQQRRQIHAWLRHMTLFTTAAVVVMSLWLGVVVHALQIQQINTRMLSDSQTRLALQLKKVGDITQQLHELQRSAREYEQRRIKGLGYLALLLFIARHIPESVWLTELAGGPDGRIQLHGESTMYPAIMTFAQVLKDDELFGEVRLLDIQRLPAQNFRFVVQVQLTPPAGFL